MQESDGKGFSGKNQTSFKARFLLYLLVPVVIISGFLAIFVTFLARDILLNESRGQIQAIVRANTEELRQHIIKREFAQATRVLQRFLTERSVVSVSLKDASGQTLISFTSDRAEKSKKLHSFSHLLILQDSQRQSENWELEIKTSYSHLDQVIEILVLTQAAVFLFVTLGFIIGFFSACDNVLFPPVNSLRQSLDRLAENQQLEPINYLHNDEIGGAITAFNNFLEKQNQKSQVLQQCLAAIELTSFTYNFSDDSFAFKTDQLPGTTLSTSLFRNSQSFFDLLQFQHRSDCKRFWFDFKEEFAQKNSGQVSHKFCLSEHVSRNRNSQFWFKITFCWNKTVDENNCCGFIENISEAKMQIENLLQSENSFRQIYDKLPIGIWRSRDDKFIYLNQTLCKMLGYKDSEEAGRQIRSIAHEVYFRPEDHTFFYDEMKKKGSVQGLEIRFRKADGRVFWGAVFGHISRDQEGSFAEGCLIDISTDREAIEKQRHENERISNSLNVGKAIAYQIDLNSGVISMYGATEELLGQNASAIKTVKDFQKLLHPEDLDLFPPKPESGKAKGNESNSGKKAQDLRICLKVSDSSGIETRWLRINYDFFDFTHHDRPGFQTGLITDFTASKQLELEIEARRNQAETANILKSEFFASISHEIRTPLNAIIGFSELLIPVIKGASEENYLNSILAAGRSLLNIVNDILDLSRLESGKLEIIYEPLSIEVLARETNALFVSDASRKGLHFEVSVDDSVPSVVLLDGMRIRQILNNLVTNAIKFTEAGRVAVFFSASPSEKEGLTDLIVSVEDTGIGISHSDKEQIFEPFLQKKGQGGKRGGTGLGLAICKRLAKMMGGEIFLKSEPGKGSRFELRLRNLRVDKLTSHLSPNSTSKARLFEFEAQRVLVVDDATSNRELLTEALTAVGLKVKSAADGEEAVKLAREFQPDLVIMDIRMPKKDGITATREIKKSGKIPVIALTASVNSVDKDHREIFDGYLHKPVKLYDLFSEAGRYLRFTLKETEKSQPVEQEKVAAIAFEQIVNPRELAGKLDLQLMSDFELFSGALSIDEVKDFATRIRTMAILHSFNLLALEAEELHQNAVKFDAIGMQKSLKKTKQILIKFLNFFKQAESNQLD